MITFGDIKQGDTLYAVFEDNNVWRIKKVNVLSILRNNINCQIRIRFKLNNKLVDVYHINKENTLIWRYYEFERGMWVSTTEEEAIIAYKREMKDKLSSLKAKISSLVNETIDMVIKIETPKIEC